MGELSFPAAGQVGTGRADCAQPVLKDAWLSHRSDWIVGLEPLGQRDPVCWVEAGKHRGVCEGQQAVQIYRIYHNRQ